MKKHRIAVGMLGAAAFAVLLLPFFIGAAGAHPATDDFTFATYTHATFLKTGSILHVLRDALSYTLRTWRDWQGTATGVFLMSINPAVFSLKLYGIHAVVLLAAKLLGWYMFLRRAMVERLKTDRTFFLTTYLVMALSSLIFLPDIVEGIYWFNGAWFYTGAEAVALMTLTVSDRQILDGARPGIPGRICVAALFFLLGMDNYMTAMMTFCILAMQALEAFLQGRRRTLAMVYLALLAAGLLLSVLAPGNQVRMETDGAHESGPGWLALQTASTLGAGGQYLLRFLFKTPLAAFLCLMLPHVAGKVPEQKGSWLHLAAVAATEYLVLCAMIFPHMYSSGYAGSGRVINMYSDFVLLSMPVAVCVMAGFLPRETRRMLNRQPARRTSIAAAAALLLLCLVQGQQKGYVQLASDQLTGRQGAYVEQVQREYRILEAAPKGSDVAVPEWTIRCMTGKPTVSENPEHWTNMSLAEYFGLHRVRLLENTTNHH